jgi:hypothetical protein
MLYKGTREMNALELSDDLEGAKLVILRLNDMLLQQQAEIEALKAENKKYEKHIAIGYLEELKK